MNFDSFCDTLFCGRPGFGPADRRPPAIAAYPAKAARQKDSLPHKFPQFAPPKHLAGPQEAGLQHGPVIPPDLSVILAPAAAPAGAFPADFVPGEDQLDRRAGCQAPHDFGHVGDKSPGIAPALEKADAKAVMRAQLTAGQSAPAV